MSCEENFSFAQWLRIFDGLNNESPVPVPEGSLFALLQKKAELSKKPMFLPSRRLLNISRNFIINYAKKVVERLPFLQFQLWFW